VTTDPEVLAHLRHELRTPLNHILGYAEMLLEEEDERGELVPLIEPIQQEGRRLLELVNALLAPARMDGGGVDMARIPVEIAPVLTRINAALDAARGWAAGRGRNEVLADLERIALATRNLDELSTGGLSARIVARAAMLPMGARSTVGPRDARRQTGASILVVDDNPTNREMLARWLTWHGYDVRLAGSGREALEALAARPADLLLLDVMMPEMDGYEVLRRVKADQGLRHIPVLMISSLDEVDSIARCIELGAEDYLPKPFEPVILDARVGACLEKKRLRDREVQQARELAELNRTLEDRVTAQVTQLEHLGRLKRFFSPRLADRIVAGGADDPLKTHRRDITVVFLDLRGFTAFAESVEPEEVMAVLREYHAAMGQLIVAHDGTLERFTGDGMMIFFNDPEPVPNPEERAVRMALEMRDRVGQLTAGWRKRGHDLALGIGIAQGYATIGAIGFEGRWDYGAIGTVTNLAARLCGEAKGGEILVSARLAAAVEDLVEAQDLGSLTLRGLMRPVPAFRIVCLKAS
jgi:class 3 adenylate cyclase